MTITNSLRQILDRKQWEMVTPCPVASVAGSFISSSLLPDQLQLFMQTAAVAYLYDPYQDSWILLPASGLGVVGAGSCGAYHPMGPAGTATAGSATTLTTNLTIPGSIAGYKVRITGGPGAGREETILSNTYGANAVLTFGTGTAITAASAYVIMSGRFYVFATNTFRYYDVALNIWSANLSVVGLPAIGTDAKMRPTPGGAATLGAGTATGGTTTTLINSAKNWATNQWTQSQVRIKTGTGAGQVRTVVSNTATTLTVSPAWTAVDATSTYEIEGNDDYIYLVGNAAVTMYRYSISANTWTTLTPAVARAGAPSLGESLSWARSNPSPQWMDESAIINGRRLYSFRGGGTSNLDYYDIPSNSWVTLPYQRQTETFTTGSAFENGLNGKFYVHKDATSRFFVYDVAKNTMDPLSWIPYPQGAAVVGDRLFTVDFVDGATTLTFLYHIRNSGVEVFRMLVF